MILWSIFCVLSQKGYTCAFLVLLILLLMLSCLSGAQQRHFSLYLRQLAVQALYDIITVGDVALDFGFECSHGSCRA